MPSIPASPIDRDVPVGTHAAEPLLAIRGLVVRFATRGGLVTAVDGVPVRSWQDLRWRLLRASGEDSVVLSLERDDGSTTTTRLKKRPPRTC